MTPSVAIIAHGGAQDTFDRHLKFWEAITPHPTVFCPIDDPIHTTHPMFPIGVKGRAVTDSIERLRNLLTTCLGDHMLIFEYDSICLDPKVSQKVQGAMLGNPMGSLDGRFIAPRYLNPPWCLSILAALEIIKKGKDYPFITEYGEVDRWLSAMAHLAGVPMLPYEPCGFSRQTIGHQHLPELRVAIYQGATMIHGIKHEVILNEAVKYYAERERF